MGQGRSRATRGADAAADADAAAAVAEAPAAPAATAKAGGPGHLKLAIVGDVHGAWRPDRDAAALRLLAPDLTLLVGDFGNESVELVRQIAALPLPKAVILGNHDAWYTMTGRGGRGRPVTQSLSAADMLAAMRSGDERALAAAGSSDGVRAQLAALGEAHVGYGTMELGESGYTVVGARPFSKGGRSFSSIRAFMTDMYGVTSMQESTERIVQAASSAPQSHPLIVVGHNGPAGLGARSCDPCGVDWEPGAGDHGDPDLQAALSELAAAGRRVALVTFGHMHHSLHRSAPRGAAGSGLRRMAALDPETGTVYLNAATVPRITLAQGASPVPPTVSPPSASPPPSPKSFGSGRRARMAAKAAAAASATAAANAAAAASTGAAAPQSDTRPTVHHFLAAELEGGEVVAARDVWVQVTPVTRETAAGVLAAARAAAAEAAEAALAGDASNAEGVARPEANGSTDIAATTAAAREAATAAAAAGPRHIDDFVVQVVREQVVLRTVVGAEGGVVKFVWNAHEQRFEPHVVGSRRTSTPDGHGGGGGGKAEEPVQSPAAGDSAAAEAQEGTGVAGISADPAKATEFVAA